MTGERGDQFRTLAWVVLRFWLFTKVFSSSVGLCAEIPRTSFKCTGDTSLDRVCTFKHLVMYNRQFYYISEGAVQLPKIEMTWKTDEVNLHWDFNVNAAHPNNLPFDLAGAEHIGDAIVWVRADLVENLYHMMAEHSPSMHAVMCRHLGYCTYNRHRRKDDIQVIFMDESVRHGDPFSQTISKLWDCHSARPFMELHDPEISDKVYLIDTALTGIGNECRAFNWCSSSTFGRRPLPLPMMDSWRVRMAQCMGTDFEAVAQARQPRVTIIQRSRRSRRSIVNILDVVRSIKAQLQTDISVFYLDGLTLAQQARLYSKSDVLIAMHGAASGNLWALPKNAVYVEIMPYFWFDRHEFEQAYINELQPLTNVKMLACDVTEYEDGHLRIDRVKVDPVYQEMSVAEKLNLFENGQCPDPSDPRRIHCALHWWLHESDGAVDSDRLVGVLRDAFSHIRHAAAGVRHEHRRRLRLYPDALSRVGFYGDSQDVATMTHAS
ncbi:hypothetical protein WJX84_004085 [Apatococcus fuscideae]|uniref:Glycosyltransferase 61 catalytic domain-containing protein n=1 Tax=Apatococcus fuscideae TaxID=2026836 RepID=A0AAW1TIS8_9CHLO